MILLRFMYFMKCNYWKSSFFEVSIYSTLSSSSWCILFLIFLLYLNWSWEDWEISLLELEELIESSFLVGSSTIASVCVFNACLPYLFNSGFIKFLSNGTGDSKVISISSLADSCGYSRWGCWYYFLNLFLNPVS